MAYEQVTQEKTYFKATSLMEGQSFEGYYLYTELSKQGWPNMVFDTTDGRKVYFSPAGNLKHLDENKTPLTPGLMTRITRTGEYKDKKSGKVVGIYKAEQDSENHTTKFSASQLEAMNQKDPTVVAAQAAVEQMRA